MQQSKCQVWYVAEQVQEQQRVWQQTTSSAARSVYVGQP